MLFSRCFVTLVLTLFLVEPVWGAAPVAPDALLDELVAPPPAQRPKPMPQPGVIPGGTVGVPARQEVPVDNFQNAWAAQCSGRNQKNPGIHYWHYAPDKTECIVIRNVGWTVFYFPEWENIEQVILGDDTSFEIYSQNGKAAKPLPNVVMLRSRAGTVSVDSTIHFIGDASDGGARNIYTAIVKSEPVNVAQFTDLTVRIDAPRPNITSAIANFESKALTANTKKGEINQPAYLGQNSPDWTRDIPFDAASLQFDQYKIYAKDEDSASIAPIRVFVDSHFTWLDFGENGRADKILRPVIFRVVDGVDNPVNTRVTGPVGNLVAIESVGLDYTLVNGNRVVCILLKKSGR